MRIVLASATLFVLSFVYLLWFTPKRRRQREYDKKYAKWLDQVVAPISDKVLDQLREVQFPIGRVEFAKSDPHHILIKLNDEELYCVMFLPQRVGPDDAPIGEPIAVLVPALHHRHTECEYYPNQVPEIVQVLKMWIRKDLVSAQATVTVD